MRITRLLVAVAAIALSPSLFAASYQDLRARVPAVDEAVGALPSSSFHGVMHRIDSALSQPRVAALGPGEYLSIPETSSNRLMSAFEDLERVLDGGLAATSVQERFVLAQAVEIVGMRRLTALYQGFPSPGGVIIVACSDEYRWGSECHSRAQKSADYVADLLERSIRDGFDQWALDHPGSGPFVLPDASRGAVSSTNLGDWLRDVAQSPAGRALGVESIDN